MNVLCGRGRVGPWHVLTDTEAALCSAPSRGWHQTTLLATLPELCGGCLARLEHRRAIQQQLFEAGALVYPAHTTPAPEGGEGA